MKLNILLIFVTLLLFSSCTRNAPETAAEMLQNKSFTQLSATEQTLFKEALKAELKKDPEFQKYTQLINEMSLQYMSRDRSKNKKLQNVEPKNSKELLQKYENKGIEDPELYIKRQMQVLVLGMKVIKKYPELAALDKQTAKEIMTEVAAPMGSRSGMSMEEIFRKIKP